MYPKRVAQDTAKVLQSYLTYQAVKTVIDELSETNPPQAIWLSQFSSVTSIQDGETYLEKLMLENKELMLRIMTVREHLAEQILEFLPAMVLSGINNSNMEHRKQLLERLTRTQTDSDTPISESPSD